MLRVGGLNSRMNVTTHPSQSSWRMASLSLVVAVTGLTVLYWPTASSIVALWSKDPLAHGYVVVPAAVYLIWDRRRELQRLNPAPSFWTLAILGLLAFLWLAGNLTATNIVQQVCLIGMISAIVWGTVGPPAGRLLVFPLAFLFFGLPIGDRVVPALQDLTARFVVKLLALSGVPVLLQGHVISIPETSWKVAEAC